MLRFDTLTCLTVDSLCSFFHLYWECWLFWHTFWRWWWRSDLTWGMRFVAFCRSWVGLVFSRRLFTFENSFFSLWRLAMFLISRCSGAAFWPIWCDKAAFFLLTNFRDNKQIRAKWKTSGPLVCRTIYVHY